MNIYEKKWRFYSVTEWIRAESNCCPDWVLTPRSFTGLAPFTLRAGNVHYPER
ncbi:hypothetical protein [Richelia intracellularis]|uniref:hypothetical protein n=1 Tax=Richelia intracellularis TaxID=1164990 RepID=UPI0018C8C6C7|nr:hypothetical protein [Richelia intracellularis]